MGLYYLYIKYSNIAYGISKHIIKCLFIDFQNYTRYKNLVGAKNTFGGVYNGKTFNGKNFTGENKNL